MEHVGGGKRVFWTLSESGWGYQPQLHQERAHH